MRRREGGAGRRQDSAERWCCPRSADHRVLVCIAVPGGRRVLLNKTSLALHSPLDKDSPAPAPATASAAGGAGGGRGWTVQKAEVGSELQYRTALREVFGLQLDGPEYGRMPLFSGGDSDAAAVSP